MSSSYLGLDHFLFLLQIWRVEKSFYEFDIVLESFKIIRHSPYAPLATKKEKIQSDLLRSER